MKHNWGKNRPQHDPWIRYLLMLALCEEQVRYQCEESMTNLAVIFATAIQKMKIKISKWR